MSNIEALCSIPQFLKGVIKLCLETKEVSAYSEEILKKIDETVRAARASDFEEWELSLAPWSPSRGWKWMDGENVELPVYMEGCKGPLCGKLKEFLPNNSLGEATAVYAFIRLIMLCDEEESDFILHDQLGKDLEIAGDDVVFVLYKFPDWDEPMRIEIDFTEITHKREALDAALPMKSGFYTQSY